MKPRRRCIVTAALVAMAIGGFGEAAGASSRPVAVRGWVPGCCFRSPDTQASIKCFYNSGSEWLTCSVDRRHVQVSLANDLGTTHAWSSYYGGSQVRGTGGLPALRPGRTWSSRDGFATCTLQRWHKTYALTCESADGSAGFVVRGDGYVSTL